MSKNNSNATLRFSCYDLLELPAAKAAGFSTHFDLLPQDNLEKLYPSLFELGMDTKRTIQIHACKHRRAGSTKVVVGYTTLGYERIDKAWLKSGNASLLARIESNPCPYFKAELYHISREGIGESGFKAMCEKVMGADGTTSGVVAKQEEADYQQVAAELKTLKDIQVAIRGNRDDIDEQ